ncbi:MAG: hypothetical protein MJ219_02080 [Mycoplasmoidaceae bacterium]|nr:hypothetical protein [Mycoplasmoidaceae bacterium]
MLNLFYQNKSLNDTLIINVSNLNPTIIQTNGDVTIGKNNDQVVFVNIKNISKKVDSKLIPEGLLFPERELISFVNSFANSDLMSHFDNGFKVGQIIECDDIKGTHLHKCKVDIGNKILDIVCGAPNARRDLKVVVATNGTMLPSGKQIIAGQLLGYKSEGMLCSYKELNINKESKGIVELDNSYQVGSYYKEPYANK